MFEKAFIAVDVSPAADTLLGSLRDLRGWGVNELVLAHVIPLGYVQGAGFAHEDEYRAWLLDRAAPLEAAGFEIRTSVTDSAVPASDLVASAAQHGDLLVVGSRSHSMLYDVFVGSVAKEVLRQATLPVLVVWLTATGAAAPPKLDVVLLATDFSSASKGAEDAAVGLAAQAGRIDCLTVLPDAAGTDERTAVERDQRELVQRITAAGGKAMPRIEEGDIDARLADAAAAGYSLVIVGKHGRNWIEGKLIGSTASKASESAKLPVLMVPTRDA
jgi:nucleotide-binding universal stress UspA family protein